MRNRPRRIQFRRVNCRLVRVVRGSRDRVLVVLCIAMYVYNVNACDGNKIAVRIIY